MTYGASAGAAAAHAAVARAIKASGAIVQVEPDTFQTILNKAEKPLVIFAPGGTFKKNFQYLMSYRELIFFTKAASPLMLSGNVELIEAKQIWIPG